MKASELCKEIIRNMIKQNEEDITSWFDFDQAREDKIIPTISDDKEYSHYQILRAINFGKEQGWFKAEWRGIGMTPWSGSAKRQRCYNLTEYGKEQAKDED
jgi:hypothetical protein